LGLGPRKSSILDDKNPYGLGSIGEHPNDGRNDDPFGQG